MLSLTEPRPATPPTTTLSFLAPEVIEKLLRERPADWFPDYDAVLLEVASGRRSRKAKSCKAPSSRAGITDSTTS